MSELFSSIKKLDIGEAKKITQPNEDERLWMVATILILSEKAGLVSFVQTKSGRRRTKVVPLPKGLVNFLETCERQGLVKIKHEKLKLLVSEKE